MINTNTVLILGAGASFDFGYPLGNDLKDEVIYILSNSEFQEYLRRGYGYRPGIKYLADEFVRDIRMDTATTIDRFLSKSSLDYKNIGKVAIAKVILEHEDNDKTCQNNISWYRILYSLINDYPDIESVGSNKISIITFNYDRSFQHFLFNQLLGDYGINKTDKIRKEISKIPIIHIHGRVNMLPWEDSEKGIAYATRDFIPDLFKIAEQMVLPDDESKCSKEAHRLIESAEVIYFLGFGYDKYNLNKLNIDMISKCKQVFGTSHMLPIAAQESVNKIFGKKLIKFISIPIYDFFMKEFNPEALKQ